MKKSILPAVVFILFCRVVTAQEEKPRAYLQNQVGFNATGLIRQFLNFSGSTTTVPTTVFDMNYKLLTGNTIFKDNYLAGLRFGLGIKDQETSTRTPTQDNTSKNDTKIYRIGLEVQHSFSKSWLIYFGLDYLRGKEEEEFSSISTPPGSGSQSISRTKSSNTTDGLGPVLGVQFNINKRLCLNTEVTFYYTDSYGSSSTEFTFGPSSSINGQMTTNKNMQFSLPNFINFNLVF